MKNLINFILFLIFYLISIPFRILPYEATQKLGYYITIAFFKILKKYNKIIINNLQYAFPNKESGFYQKIYKENLKHIGMLLADTFLKSRMKEKWFKKRIIYDESSQNIEKEILNKLKNKEAVILVSGHLGSWENLAQYIGYRFYPNTGIIYKTIKNPYIDQWFYKMRSITGAKLFRMEDSLLAIKFLQEGNLLGIAPDQNAGGAGIMIEFLNRPASTYKGPALIAYMSNANIYFVAILHQPKGKMKLLYEYLGKINEEIKTNKTKEEIIFEWTQKWVKILEKYIKIYPEQYFWVHQRWKTTPEIMKKFEQEKLQKRKRIKN
jgi:KDO2-lipid IV(A) lauroyltransferase